MDNGVIATTAVVERVIDRFQNEAAPEIHPDTDPRFEGITDLEKAGLVAGLNNARDELRGSEKVRGVMNTAQNKYASLLQTMIVQHETDAEPIAGLSKIEAT